MAGVVPKRSASGRKQWSLQDGPRSSLKLLRNQLANEGCSESQVVLAKQLLESEQQTYSKSERKENERLGVYWLIKASEQGNEEATELLKSCLKTGKGISEYNYLDVKNCISMTQDEKLTRKAAKNVFASLSNGGEYITTDQLQKKILTISKGEDMKSTKCSESLENGDIPNGDMNKSEDESSDSEIDDWNKKCDNSSCNEKITEEHLVSAAVDYSQGHLPLMNKSLCLVPPNLQALDRIPFVHRSILHPLLALKICYYKVLRFLGKKITFLNLRSETQLMILITVYTIFNLDDIHYAIPVILYYLVFIYMTLTTCQMLQNQRDFLDFRLWSGLFICYSGGNLNAGQAEYQYIRNNLKPYGHFFIALLVNFLLYSVISKQWVPDSELAIISFCLTFITLIGFMPKKRSKISLDITILFSFAINVLAKYPYENDSVVTQGWRFLDLKIPTFASYIIGNGIEFCLNFRLILYMMIPILFIRIASQQNWRGTYKILIPHCVTLSWLQICVISSQGATMYGLLRSVLALVGVVMFLPLVGLTSILLPAIAFTKWVFTTNTIYTVGVFVIISSVALFISWMLAQTRFKNYTAFVQVIMMLIAFLTLLNLTIDSENLQFSSGHKEPKYLTWDIFQKFCHQPVWQDENIAVAQLKCAELDDTLIYWDGYINDIKIKSVKNNYKKIMSNLPRKIYDHLSCYFGEEVTDSLCENLTETNREDCQMFYNIRRYTNTCSLDKFNVYTFEIVVTMTSGIWGKSPEVTLIVDDYFHNFTMKLKSNDHIWFKGKLFNNENVGSEGILGGMKPHIRPEEIGCYICQNKKLSKLSYFKETSFSFHTLMQYLYESLKFILNILFNPIILA